MEQAKRPRKAVSVEESVIQALSYILGASISVYQPGTSTASSNKRSLRVARSQLPSGTSNDGSAVEKIQHLFSECRAWELKGVVYSAGAYDRSCGQIPSHGTDWDRGAWKCISSAAKEASTRALLQVLIDATSNEDSQDLFELYADNAKGLQGELGSFVEGLSGWGGGFLVPVPLLESMLLHAKQTSSGKQAVMNLVKMCAKDLVLIKRPEEIVTQGHKNFDALETLFSQPVVGEMVAERLLEEVKEAVKHLGDYYEKESILSGLLSVTTIIPSLSPLHLQSDRYSCFTGMRNFPSPSVADMDQCHGAIQAGLHRCCVLTHSILKLCLKSPRSKGSTLAWMASIVTINEMRAGPQFELKKSPQGVCSDGFLVNFCAVMLEFCKPFFSNHPSAKKLPLIVPQYPSSPFCRLDLHNESCLAGGIITAEERLGQGYERFLGEGGNFKFVTECFFITLRALHVGLLPATDKFHKITGELSKQIDRQGDKLLHDLRGLHVQSGICCLLDPQFVQFCSEFYITQSVWLLYLMESCQKPGLSEEEVQEQQRKMFSAIPEFGVKDMVRWFWFVLRIRANLLRGLQLTPFVDCCICLLERPDLLPGPVAQSKIISVLLMCVGKDRDNSQQLRGIGSWSGIHGDLSAMVQGSPTFRDRLGPALLHTFAAVDVVEGLDVDKENFDKYSARFEISQLLLHLWRRTDCRDSLLRECEGKKFRIFLGAIFDTLLYTLHDSLYRIMNIHKMEQARGDVEKRQNGPMIVQEQSVAKGFLALTGGIMELLVSTTEVDGVASHLAVPPLAPRAAAAVMGFLDILCGPRHTQLKIKDPDKIGFDPKKLVNQIASVVAHAWRMENKTGKAGSVGDGFTVSLVNHPDFSRAALGKAEAVLQRHLMLDAQVATNFSALLNKLDQLTSGGELPGTNPDDPLAQASLAIKKSSGAPPPGTVEEWQRRAERINVDMETLQEMYVGALEDSKFGSAEFNGVHALNERTPVALNPRTPRLKSILRDVKLLRESLPIHPDSAIFVRQDEDRIDLIRVLITGPVDTPYSYGCFVFDIRYPANYPVNPPLVLLTTTGNGTIRFNPNLYADGKVCLSLLGTWHGGDFSEKWDAVRSNLMQVLVSIQGLILIPDPIYNEPGYERMKDTPQGRSRSAHYNAYVQVNTIRYAMTHQLRNPPVGFEDTVKIHFMLVREVLLKQCSKWLRNAISPDHETKLRRAISELRNELDQL